MRIYSNPLFSFITFYKGVFMVKFLCSFLLSVLCLGSVASAQCPTPRLDDCPGDVFQGPVTTTVTVMDYYTGQPCQYEITYCWRAHCAVL